MLIRVLVFGSEAAALQQGEVAVMLPEGATCSELRSRLFAEYPALRPSLAAARFAVNGEFVPDEPGEQKGEFSTSLREGDEVALIGLVSGG